MKTAHVHIFCPNGYLGFTPIQETAFRRGVEQNPDYYCCNAGARINDPTALGTDTGISLYKWQKHDLELMLLASRKQRAPLLVGTAGDTGANSRVDLFVDILKSLARKHNLTPFKLIYFYSEIEKPRLRTLMEQNVAIEHAESGKALTEVELEKTERIVAVAGVHPFLRALEMGADVIIGGRCASVAPFAAAALHARHSPESAYVLGPLLTRPAAAMQPNFLNGPLIASLHDHAVSIFTTGESPMPILPRNSDELSQTLADLSEASFQEGRLDMTQCRYEYHQGQLLSVTGQRFSPAQSPLKFFLEGAGRSGERFIELVSFKTSAQIPELEIMLEETRKTIEHRFSESHAQLAYTVLGKRRAASKLQESSAPQEEVTILIEGVAETEQLSEELATLGARRLLPLLSQSLKPIRISRKVLSNCALLAPPVYRLTIQHTLPLADPLELFQLHEITIGV